MSAFEVDFPRMKSVFRQIIDELVPFSGVDGDGTVDSEIDEFVEASACETKVGRNL